MLPDGFVKLRHYGLLAPGNVNTRLAAARKLLEPSGPLTSQGQLPAPATTEHAETWREMLLRLTGVDVTRCASCGGDIESRPLARVPPRDTS